MQTVLKWFGSASRAGAIVAGWALLAISFATVFEILGRKYFNFSFRSLDEIGGYMLAGVSAFGFAYALSQAFAHARDAALSLYSALRAIDPQCARHGQPGGHGRLLRLARRRRGSRAW